MAGGLLALGGCALFDVGQGKSWKVEPLMRVQDAPLDAAAYLALGHYHAGMRDWARAEAAYRKVLAREPEHSAALDALGQTLAQAGRLDEAEATLRRALALAPQQPHLRNNLGYVLLLAGRPQEAAREFGAVLAQDAGNRVAQANLRQATGQASLAAGPGLPPSSLPPVQAAAEPPAMPASAPRLQIGYLPTRPALPQFSGAPPADSLAHSPPAASAFPVRSEQPDGASRVLPAAVRLEVSNGNGINGLAARVGQWLQQRGMPVARLSNQLPYSQRLTVVQYRPGFEAAARQVALALPEEAGLEPLTGAELRSDVRVLLGQDLAATARLACAGTLTRC